MVGSSYLILKGIYLLFLRYAIPSIPPMLLLYSGGSYLFIFLCVLGWKRVGRLESNQQKRCLLALRLSMRSVRTQFARKGRPSLRSHSPELPWARSFWLPFKVAYFVPVCKRAKIGLLLSCLYHPSFSWRGEFLISLVVTSIVGVEGRFPPVRVRFTFNASS